MVERFYVMPRDFAELKLKDFRRDSCLIFSKELTIRTVRNSLELFGSFSRLITKFLQNSVVFMVDDFKNLFS